MQHLGPYVVEAIFNQLRVGVSGITRGGKRPRFPEPKGDDVIGQAAAVVG
jgi:hypothetical protein